VAAVRYDPVAAVSQCALFSLPHVSTVLGGREKEREGDSDFLSVRGGHPPWRHRALFFVIVPLARSIRQCCCECDAGLMRDVRVW